MVFRNVGCEDRRYLMLFLLWGSKASQVAPELVRTFWRKENYLACAMNGGHILSAALTVNLLLQRLSFPSPNNRIFAVKNCSYGTDRTCTRVFCVCVLFLETLCCVLRLRGRSLLWRRLGVILGWPESGVGLCCPYKKDTTRNRNFP